MGDSRAVTSTHKDPYENMYIVVRGCKDIILYPPSDLPYMPYRSCKPAKYTRTCKEENGLTKGEVSSSSLSIIDLDGPAVPWIVVDPLQPDFMRYPKFSQASPFHIRLYAGDVLYLPSLWFHHLRQSEG